VQLLFRPDHEVAGGQDAAQVLRDRLRADEPRLAGAVAGKAPEVRPVVHVEGDLRPAAFAAPIALRLMAATPAWRMRARHHHGRGAGDETLVHVRSVRRMSAQFSR
jgi:hypothetical protein